MTKIKREDLRSMQKLAEKLNEELTGEYSVARRTNQKPQKARERMMHSAIVMSDLRRVENILSDLEALE